MKKILIFLSLVIAIVLGSVNCFAVGNTISEQEAKDLLLAANNYYCKYQGYVGSFLNNGDHGKPFITTKHDVSEAARKIYTEDIADNMWSYQCFLNLEKYDGIESPDLYCYLDNGDGTITIVSEFPQYFRKYYLGLDYSSENYYKKAESSDQIKIRRLSGDSHNATALVEVYKAKFDMTSDLVYMDVCFTNTANGWRISGGSLVYAFSNWSNPNLKYESVCGAHGFMDGYTSKTMANFASQASDPDYYYTAVKKGTDGQFYWMDLEEVRKQFGKNLEFDFLKLISYSEDKIVYLLVNNEDGKIYDAVYTYDENYVYPWPKNIGGSDSETKKGCWRLTGGGVYDLVTGKKDVAPYTGDEANNTLLIAVAVSVVSLLGMGVALKARKA